VYTSIPAAPEAGYPSPAKDRGVYFDGLTNYITVTDKLHYNGMLDIFFRATTLTGSARTLFSISTATADHFLVYLTASGFIGVSLIATNVETGVEGLVAVEDSTAAIVSGSWTFVAITWSKNDSLNIYKNSDSTLATAALTNSILEDRAAYISTIGLEWDDQVGSPTSANLFAGFVYSFALAGVVGTPSSYYETTCTGYGGCSLCPTTGDCLSTCGFDEFPIAD
jgi:hypothetical protein